jgi:hypothetical protein
MCRRVGAHCIALHHAAAVGLNGKLYVIGGFVEGWTPTDEVHEYVWRATVGSALRPRPEGFTLPRLPSDGCSVARALWATRKPPCCAPMTTAGAAMGVCQQRVTALVLRWSGAAMRVCQQRVTAFVLRRSRTGFTSSRAGHRPATRFRRPMRFSCRKLRAPTGATTPFSPTISASPKPAETPAQVQS